MKKSDLINGVIFFIGGIAISILGYFGQELYLVITGCLVSSLGGFSLGAFWWSIVIGKKQNAENKKVT
jgi:hypothetical protein